jgi:hypothetical protein
MEGKGASEVLRGKEAFQFFFIFLVTLYEYNVFSLFSLTMATAITVVQAVKIQRETPFLWQWTRKKEV